MAYIFDTHYGHSSLADDQTGIVIEWQNGNFNDTQTVHFEGTVFPEDADLSQWMATKMREMGEYIVENYPELI